MSRSGKPRPLDVVILIFKVVLFSIGTIYIVLNFSGWELSGWELVVVVLLLLYAAASQVYLHIKRQNMTIAVFRWLFAKAKGMVKD